MTGIRNTIVFIILALAGIVELHRLASAAERIAYQATLTNCLVQARMGELCLAARATKSARSEAERQDFEQ